MNRPKQIGGLRKIFQRQVEEQRLARLAGMHFLADGLVVGVAVLEGLVEDRRIRRQASDR